MALDYSFEISSSLSPESLMRAFLMSLGMLGSLKNDFEAGTKNFHVMVNRLQGRSREIEREQFGFEPDVYLTFRTGAATGIEAQEQIVRGTLAICQATTGDAVLLFNGEVILFIRRAGTIYVNTNYWRGDYSCIPHPTSSGRSKWTIHLSDQSLLREVSGVEGVSMRCLRHYFAVSCLSRGIPISNVSAWMGHSEIDLTVKRYGRFSADAREQWTWAALRAKPIEQVVSRGARLKVVK